MTKTIRISATRDGYRRAGHAHSMKPKDWPSDAFSGEQLQQLHDDPRITVQEVEPAKAPAKAKPQNKQDGSKATGGAKADDKTGAAKDAE